MRPSSIPNHSYVTALILLLACDAQREGVVVEPSLSSPATSEWSDPVNLGPVVNTAFIENNATLSTDGLTLYFGSDRPGGLGLIDIWVARRASLDGAWEPPVNLGPPINTPFIDGAPALSSDGHLLFIHSNRPGTLGGNDIWLARRSGSTDDDTSWETPVSLGPDVNSADDEQGPDYTTSAGGSAIYFNRGNQALGRSDLFYARVGPGGQTHGPAVPITELNDPALNDAAPGVRTDGKEILFWSSRAGSLGGFDLWRSARQSGNDAWSPPENVGAPLNSPVADLHPEFSHDGRTLILSSNRPGGFGSQDLWVSTRIGSSP